MAAKVAIFGAAGQLGTELTSILRARGAELLCLTRSEIDITNEKEVEQRLTRFDPAVVINSAAYNMVDLAEREAAAAFQVNALAVRNMAMVCRQLDARLVHFSMDYVFDGTAGRAYTEDDAPHPLGAYGVSKLAGEFYARAYLDHALVIRTCGVFGPGGMRTARGNFIETMLRMGATTTPIRVVEDHVASPTYAPALAARSIALLDSGASGIFHVGGGEPISWFEYAGLIFEAAGMRPELRATSEREHRASARRPKFSALDNGKMERAGIPAMPPLRDAIRDYLSARASLNAAIS